ncbi:hypothetical protein [Aneurinibacillus aneurinilyticus]|uniref:hypothetical protein n=1 Tax=Aneurinibacillus aneurinilyticus TaxID=1391 RepID=UPI0023F4E7B0|nr:hypothetical protein [Aneurinibacillus aneurinilyticus]
MKRLVPAMCAVALTLSIPVAAGASYQQPSNPFLDNAPNYEDWAREQAEKDNASKAWDNRYLDPNYVIDVNEPQWSDAYWGGDEPVYREATYVDREYVVVAVNPKLKRYMVKSVEPTPVKMKQNVIFTQGYVITEQPLKKGDRVWLTFDEDESDGIDSDRKDGLVYVTPEWVLMLPAAEE